MSDLGATIRVGRGLNLLSSGRHIVTDRLHGHIMSVLLGIPHVVIDNGYGKIGGYIDAWTAGSGVVQKAESLTEALLAMKRLEQRQGRQREAK
jgi:pyruvyl transferase EpsO